MILPVVLGPLANTDNQGILTELETSQRGLALQFVLRMRNGLERIESIRGYGGTAQMERFCGVVVTTVG